MSMSRKDFERIAEEVKYKFKFNEKQKFNKTEVIDMLVSMLKSTNPRFKEQRFRTACGE